MSTIICDSSHFAEIERGKEIYFSPLYKDVLRGNYRVLNKTTDKDGGRAVVLETTDGKLLVYCEPSREVSLSPFRSFRGILEKWDKENYKRRKKRINEATQFREIIDLTSDWREIPA